MNLLNGIVTMVFVTLLSMVVSSRVECASIIEADPRVTLWAWSGPDDLRVIDPRRVAVAFLAGTIVSDGQSVTSRPRSRELKVTPEIQLIAVVRFETHLTRTLSISLSQRTLIVRQILELTDRPGVGEVQVDFDALVSERAFYRELLADLRRELRPGLRLSMTALSSWCLGDPWISALPVDRAVPMLFRMGDDDGRVRSHLAAGGTFGPAVCRGDVGVSTDEPFPPFPAGARIWIFHPKPWNSVTVRELLGTMEKR